MNPNISCFPKLELSSAFDSLEFIIWGHKINTICKSICQAICWNMMNWICSCEFGTFPFHTVVITKSEWLDWDNCNLYLTETKQWLAFYLYLLMFVIPNSPNHITMSASLREWAWRRVYSLLVDIIGSNRIYFCYSQLLHISRMVVLRSFTGDVILDLTSIWL